jgi:DNA-binding MarR family transcriptional regulator
MVDATAVEQCMRASRVLVGIAVRSIEASPDPLTVVQHRCLVLLEEYGALPVGFIAAELGVNQSNASRLCDRLERAGLVERRRAPDDGRSVTVHITTEGIRALARVADLRRYEIHEVLSGMNARDVRDLNRALAAFTAAAHHPGPES